MSLSSMLLPNPVTLLASSSFTTQAVDASNDGSGLMIKAPKAGNISKIGFLISSVTSPPTYRFGLESTSGRTPSGTYLASGSAYVDAVPSAGFAWRTLGAAAAVSAGDMLAATVRYQSGTIGGSNLINVAHSVSSLFSTSYGQPFPTNLTAGTWTAAGTLPVAAIEYDDSTIVAGCCPCATLVNNTTWNTGSNPLYIGSKLVPPVGCRLLGIWFALRPASAGNWTAHVFEGSAPTSPIASVSFAVGNDVSATSAVRMVLAPFAGVTLTAGTTYRFMIEPTSASNPITLVYATFNSAAERFAYSGDLIGCTGDSSEAWTDYTDRAYPVIPLLDQFDVVSGGGGGPLIGGRLVAA